MGKTAANVECIRVVIYNHTQKTKRTAFKKQPVYAIQKNPVLLNFIRLHRMFTIDVLLYFLDFFFFIFGLLFVPFFLLLFIFFLVLFLCVGLLLFILFLLLIFFGFLFFCNHNFCWRHFDNGCFNLCRFILCRRFWFGFNNYGNRCFGGFLFTIVVFGAVVLFGAGRVFAAVAFAADVVFAVAVVFAAAVFAAVFVAFAPVPEPVALDVFAVFGGVAAFVVFAAAGFAGLAAAAVFVAFAAAGFAVFVVFAARPSVNNAIPLLR
ncbi:MAG: hypothetical protein H6629_05780 [Calditrichae bacterium]|nr:hypothetical protein [Calditrichia bacterium]